MAIIDSHVLILIAREIEGICRVGRKASLLLDSHSCAAGAVSGQGAFDVSRRFRTTDVIGVFY
jgi:hypothetical protein